MQIGYVSNNKYNTYSPNFGQVYCDNETEQKFKYFYLQDKKLQKAFDTFVKQANEAKYWDLYFSKSNQSNDFGVKVKYVNKLKEEDYHDRPVEVNWKLGYAQPLLMTGDFDDPRSKRAEVLADVDRKVITPFITPPVLDIYEKKPSPPRDFREWLTGQLPIYLNELKILETISEERFGDHKKKYKPIVPDDWK